MYVHTKRSCGVIKYVEETLGLLLWASFLSINLALLSHADKPHELIVISILQHIQQDPTLDQIYKYIDPTYT